MVSFRCIHHTILVLVLIIATSAVAQDVTAVRANSIEIAEDVHFLPGLSCNVVVVTGPEGVLIIDNGSSRNREILKEEIAKLASGPIRIAINTHFHFDHVGANQALGVDGTVIIAHDHARRRMMTEWQIPETLGVSYPVIPPYPDVALPTLTFDRTLTVHFNGHEIEVIHFPNAHSDADVVVFVRDRNVLHTGDLYLSNGFPILDSYHGGTIDGLISALDGLIDLVDENTKVVPGHGPLSNRKGLREYQQMLGVGRDRIAALIEEGKTLEESVAADPLADLYSQGQSWLPPKLFIWTVYVDLARRR